MGLWQKMKTGVKSGHAGARVGAGPEAHQSALGSLGCPAGCSHTSAPYVGKGLDSGGPLHARGWVG